MRRINITRRIVNEDAILPGETIELHTSGQDEGQLYIAQYMRGYRCGSCNITRTEIGRCPLPFRLDLKAQDKKGKRLCTYRQVVLKSIDSVLEGL
jgi:hypothetical protein